MDNEMLVLIGIIAGITFGLWGLIEIGIAIWKIISYCTESRRIRRNRRRCEEFRGRSQSWSLESFYDDTLLEEHHQEMLSKYNKNGKRWRA